MSPSQSYGQSHAIKLNLNTKRFEPEKDHKNDNRNPLAP